MEIEFHGRLDKNLFYKAVALANRPSQRTIIIRIIFLLVILSIFIAYFVVVATRDTYSSNVVFRAVSHLITLLVVGIFLVRQIFSSPIIASRLWKDPNTRKAIVGRLSNTGICYISSTSENNLKWESIAKWRKADDFVVLLTQDGVLSIFPKTFFDNENDWKKFQELVESKVEEPI